MATFDETRIVVGTMSYRSNGTLATTSTSHFGIDGTNISVSHPWPYVSGSSWTLDRYDNEPATYDGYDASFIYKDFQAFVASDPIAAPVVDNMTINNLLARTNPSRPIVDFPVAIAELRDLPRLFKIAGDTFLKKGGSSYLNYEFGWKPFLSDLKGILDFQGTIDRRTRELTKLYENGGSHHRASCGSGAFRTSGTAGTFKGSTIYTSSFGSSDAWMTCKWVPDFGPTKRPPSVDEIRHKAFRSAFGLEASLSTVWEALPWSWLIDWFSDLGDYCQAHRNAVGATPGQCFRMVHSESTTIYTILSEHPSLNPNITVSGPAVTRRTRKTRSVLSPAAFPSVSFPFLTGRQLGILGSLAVLRH